jgi:hypothetical protein
MTDTAIIGRNVEVVQTSVAAQAGFSWGAAIAGAVAATAVSFLLISLGSGIGFLVASPYGAGPSATTLTAAGAIWIVLAQTWGFAVGGYLAGRLRTTAEPVTSDETNFRDGAHGFVAWALGVLLTVGMVATAGMFTAGLTGQVASAVAPAALGQNRTAGGEPSAYYADALFRREPQQFGGRPQPSGNTTASQTTPAAPGGMPTPQGETPPTMQAQQPALSDADVMARNEAGRIFSSGVGSGRLSDEDRNYLGRVVGARTGLTPEESNKRVQEVEARMTAAAKEAADKAAKAASLLSFWTFMSLLMGAAAAVVGGIVGGNQRDDNLRFGRAR